MVVGSSAVHHVEGGWASQGSFPNLDTYSFFTLPLFWNEVILILCPTQNLKGKTSGFLFFCVSMSHHSIWKFMNSFCSLDYDLVQNGGHGSTCKSKIPGCSCLCVAVHPTVLWPRIYGHSSTEHKSTTAQRQRTIPIFDCNTISSCLCIAMSHLSDPEVAWIHSVSPITIWIRMEDLVAHETNKQNGGLLDRRHLEDNLPTAQSQFAWSTASPKNISLNRGTAYSTDSYGWVKILVLVTRDINRGTAYSTDSYGWVKFWSSWLEI